MSRRDRILEAMPILWFSALLVAPLVGHWLGADADESPAENRVLAPAPNVTQLAASPSSFADNLSDWLNDHFGFRRELIRLDIEIRDWLDLRDESRAVRGDDGWIFNTLENALKMHQGYYPFLAGEMQDWLSSLSEIQSHACGAPVIVLLVPNKHSVYPERLSEHPRRSAAPTRLEALENATPPAGVRIVSVRRLLLAAKPIEQVYYRTDTHWNTYGAYVGYQAMVDALIDEGLPLTAVSEDRLRISGEREIIGDLNSLLGDGEPEPEVVPRWTISAPTPVKSVERLAEFDFGSFEAKRTIMAAPDRPRLLLIGDSFASQMERYLRESFGEIVFVHHRNGAPPIEIVRQCNHDAVVLQMVERALSHPLKPKLKEDQD